MARGPHRDNDWHCAGAYADLRLVYISVVPLATITQAPARGWICANCQRARRLHRVTSLISSQRLCRPTPDLYINAPVYPTPGLYIGGAIGDDYTSPGSRMDMCKVPTGAPAAPSDKFNIVPALMPTYA
ncbi:hypothetical protein BZG79_04445 [Salinivibrio sp. MA427]|nr:hypothetical protein BZG79_04445 [Salinivibrio sp. MA427]